MRPAVQVPPDAYLDSGAADIVRRARARREGEDKSLLGYRAVATQRVGVGIRALHRDRILYHHELAARIEWHRGDTARVEALGARAGMPIVRGGEETPDGLRSLLGSLAFDPDRDLLRVNPRDTARDDMVHPLAAGSETSYRFRSGDTTVLTFPDGRRLRVLELEILPRRSEFRLVAGSLWFDASTYAMVRAVFRTARPFDLAVDGDPGDANDVPAALQPVRAEIRFITIEYGLQGYRWWLPRIIALDGVAQAGSLVQIPVRFERVYSEYQVDGGGGLPPGRAMPLAEHPAHPVRIGDGTRARSRPRTAADSARALDAAAAAGATGDRPRRGVRISIGGGARRDSTGVRSGVRVDAGNLPDDTARARRRRERRERGDSAFPVVVTFPADTGVLAESPYLPPAIFDPGQGMVTESELREVARTAGLLPALSMPPHAGFRWAPRDPTLLRYNRVEGLSFGARFDAERGAWALDAAARLGWADLAPNAELGVTRASPAMRLRLGGYYRLAAADPETKPFGLGNSLGALLFGRDDGEYYRALGAELTSTPALARTQWWSWRLYAERQRAVVKETDASLPHLFSRAHSFRDNVVAAPAREVGASLTVRGQRGADPAHLVFGVELAVDGATGDYDFAKGALTARVASPLPFGTAGALELSAGSSAGAVPPQSLWYLGGPATLRGYGGAAAAGDGYWRARLELASRATGARLALFGDAGWAGARSDFAAHAPFAAKPLLSFGVGASFLDGLVRLDVARAVRAPQGWRVDLYWDGAL